jgi:hypothetical protein
LGVDASTGVNLVKRHADFDSQPQRLIGGDWSSGEVLGEQLARDEFIAEEIRFRVAHGFEFRFY